MAGQLQVVGAATGMAAGKAQFEGPTASGTKAMPEVKSVRLVANTDLKIEVPPEAVAWALLFQSTSTASEIKVRTNLNSADAGTPISTLAAFKADLFSGTTEIILKSPSAPIVFQIVFI